MAWCLLVVVLGEVDSSLGAGGEPGAWKEALGFYSEWMRLFKRRTVENRRIDENRASICLWALVDDAGCAGREERVLVCLEESIAS